MVALVGGRVLRYAGYNRALTAQRQVGSVLKPVIYLTALEAKGKYGSLSSRISDGPVKVRLARGN